jgi:hypothetical protein
MIPQVGVGAPLLVSSELNHVISFSWNLWGQKIQEGLTYVWQLIQALG